MNIACLELCKELYGLSGWNDTYFCWSSPNRQSAFVTRLPNDFAKQNYVLLTPSYDLGYLLRKLPSEISIEKKYNHENGAVYYAESSTGFESANTPEDAACKLAIDLFNQGILKE